MADAPKRVNVREYLKENAELQERRLREKEPLVSKGDWTHHRRLGMAELVAGLTRNTEELFDMANASPLPDADAVAKQVADLCNWACFLGLRLRGKD